MKIGICGFGYMGRTHLNAWRAVDGVNVSVICDKSPNADGGHNDLTGIEIVDDYDAMLAADIDAVSVTLPTHLHYDATIRALRAGKHVLCEKPMSLNLDECRQMIDTAAEQDKHLQIGHCIRFWPQYTRLREIIADQRYGKLLAVTLYRLGSFPDWGECDWFADKKKSGGVLADLHIHDVDFLHFLLGTPRWVHAVATGGADEPSCHVSAIYGYDGLAVSAEGSWCMSPTFSFRMGFRVAFEDATLEYSSDAGPAIKVCPRTGEPFDETTAEDDAYLLQSRHFLDCVRNGRDPGRADPRHSLETVRIVLAENESIATGRRIVLDMPEDGGR